MLWGFHTLGLGVTGALTTGAEGYGFKTVCAPNFSKTLSVHPVVNGYLTLFIARGGEGGEEEK